MRGGVRGGNRGGAKNGEEKKEEKEEEGKVSSEGMRKTSILDKIVIPYQVASYLCMK